MFRIKIVKNIITHILCSVTFFFDYHAVYEKTWKNIEELCSPQMTVWRTRIAFWIPKVTNTNTQVA
jgi:hypothetical protein